MNYALGLDIGGTNIKALAVTPAGRLLADCVVASGDTGKKNWVNNVRVALDRIERKLHAPPACIGIAAPGLAAQHQRSISFMPCRLPGLEGLDWKNFFKVSHSIPVLNDAHAALLGEIWRGAARGAENALLLTLGTGVGGAAMVDGRLLRGHLGRAGHFGHISLDPAGTRDITNTPGSLEDAIGECSVKARTSGRFTSTRSLVAACGQRDAEARRLWLQSVQALAAGVTSLINALDPEVVVVGGGIAKAGPELFRPLKSFLRRYEWRPGGAKVQIVPARLGDQAGAFGAAWHALQFQEETR